MKYEEIFLRSLLWEPGRALGVKIFTKVCVELGKGKHFDWLLLTGFHSQICLHWGSHSFIRYSLRVPILVLVPAEDFPPGLLLWLNCDFHIQLSVSPIWGQQFSLPPKVSAKKRKMYIFLLWSFEDESGGFQTSYILVWKLQVLSLCF